MEYKFTIPCRLSALNEYTSANRINPYIGAAVKHDNEKIVITAIRQHLRGVRINKPVIIHYHFYELNMRRDKDNILSCAMKFTQDSLVKCGVLKNDGWKEIINFTHTFDVDADNPRIEVILEEVSED